MAILSRKVGDMSYDNLIAGITPPVHVNSGTLRNLDTETAYYARGTVLAKSSVDGKLVILGTQPDQTKNEILTPDCILCDDVTVGPGANVDVAVYTAGCFNVDALIVKSNYVWSENDKDKLRERGIYLGIVLHD